MKNTIFTDADVKRSMAYLAISVVVAGVKSVIETYQERRQNTD